MSTIIGIQELRKNATQIAKRAQKGEVFTVVKRSKPILTVSAAQTSEENLKDWTKEAIRHYRPALVALSKK
ncbi:hypothetical protein H6792_01020 [Candidatus Nomurabacteria bacterium]|nr:hypothetical protein [Candidatus Nomurabacteria bacterium]